MAIKNTQIWQEMSRKKRRFLSLVAPRYQTQKIYEGNFGRKLNWENPTDINEKIQCLKLGKYYNNPVITECVDKLKVRDYLKKHPNIKCAELYGQYDSPEEITWDELPDSFVIKCNHGCGFNIICKDKSSLDRKAAENSLREWLKEDYWREFCETQYKYVEKKILIEEYLGDDILTYKLYCFNGIPKVLYVSSNGENGEKDKYIDYFDMDWNHLDVTLKPHPNSPRSVPKPENLSKLVEAAKELSGDFPFVRVDLYDIGGEIYISELTFVPTGGFMILSPDGTSEEWGSWLDIR